MAGEWWPCTAEHGGESGVSCRLSTPAVGARGRAGSSAGARDRTPTGLQVVLTLPRAAAGPFVTVMVVGKCLSACARGPPSPLQHPLRPPVTHRVWWGCAAAGGAPGRGRGGGALRVPSRRVPAAGHVATRFSTLCRPPIDAQGGQGGFSASCMGARTSCTLGQGQPKPL